MSLDNLSLNPFVIIFPFIVVETVFYYVLKASLEINI